MINYCKRCLYGDHHPLGIQIDHNGLCSGCFIHEEKNLIDWDYKENELKNILSKYKNVKNDYYDCVIPVNGNSDSYFVVDTIKNKYGLNPLLVTYNSHFNTKIGIRNLARLVTKLDCDHLIQTVSPSIVKRITKIAFKELGDIYWHVNAGSQTFPVQVATKFNIPLVIWGVNGWLDQVGMFSHHDNAEMSKKVRKEHSLRGEDAEELLLNKEQLSKQDIQPFVYPSDSQLEASRVRGLYLGNFLRWDAQKQSESMIEKFGYETKKEDRTFNNYETINCWNNQGVHDYLKYIKFGYGKATDHACRDIRLERMTREEGIDLAKKYDPIVPETSIKIFLNWIEMDRSEFDSILELHRNLNIWEKGLNGNWFQKEPIKKNQDIEAIDNLRLNVNNPRKYIETEILEIEDPDKGYILMGRNYIDQENYKAIEG